VGAFAGALLAAPLGRALGTGRALAVALAVGQAAVLLIPLATHAGRWAVPLLAAQQLVGDAFLTAFGIHSVSIRQRELPGPVLGRANATFHVVTGALLPAGALLSGPLAEALGIAAALWIGAAGGLLAPLLLAGAEPRPREPVRATG
jgi:predicted MFS family arabinose efflux permease